MKRFSESNEVCIQQQLMVSIPNALYVGGLNANWKPVLNLMKLKNIKFLYIIGWVNWYTN